jgi:hypothetical protein
MSVGNGPHLFDLTTTGDQDLTPQDWAGRVHRVPASTGPVAL